MHLDPVSHNKRSHLAMKSLGPITKSSPCLPKLERARKQQQRPSATINKLITLKKQIRYRFSNPPPDILIGDLQELNPRICIFRCFSIMLMSSKTKNPTFLVFSDKGSVVGSTLVSNGRSLSKLVTSKEPVLSFCCVLGLFFYQLSLHQALPLCHTHTMSDSPCCKTVQRLFLSQHIITEHTQALIGF